MDKRDKVMHAGLVKILQDATFPIRRREAVILDQVCRWVEEELPLKLKEAPKKEEEEK